MTSSIPEQGAAATGSGSEVLARVYRFVFVAHLAAVAALQRDFSRLHFSLAGVPIFANEATILLLGSLLVAITVWRRRLVLRLGALEWLLLAYLAVGAAFTARGLAVGFGLAALRDAALVYYAAFAFFALAFRELGGTTARVARALVGGSVVGALVWTGRFLARPSLIDGHAVPSFAGILAWLGLVGVLLPWRYTRGWRGVGRWFGVAACSFVVFLSAYRTMLGVLLASLLAVLAGRHWAGEVVQHLRPSRLVAWLGTVALVTAALAALPLSRPVVIDGDVPAGHALAVVSRRWLGGMAAPGARPGSAATLDVRRAPWGSVNSSVAFRTQAWRNALLRIRHSPWVGVGFGPPAALFPDFHCELASSPLSNCGNAHNTYLTIAMRTGLPVLALVAAVNLVALGRGLAALGRRGAGGKSTSSLVVILGLYASLASYGVTSLLLESPHLAVPFWVIVGTLAASNLGGKQDHTA
ncbi:MAG: O-antigen ligase family protein [Thermoanaerobaculaceae bacterium]|nr:O-antigen ligase family protein [Thermoanaerobaculaceae bacterium]